MMADLFIAYWPMEMVREILPRGVVLDVSEAGARTVRQGETVILLIEPDAQTPNRLRIKNELLNYELTIDSQALE